MVRSTPRRTLVLLVLCVLLVSPGLSTAAPRSGSRVAPVTTTSMGDLLGWLRSSLASLWSKAGCQVDPDGRCLNGLATTPTDNGCQVDPNGRCRN